MNEWFSRFVGSGVLQIAIASNAIFRNARRHDPSCQGEAKLCSKACREEVICDYVVRWRIRACFHLYDIRFCIAS